MTLVACGILDHDVNALFDQHPIAYRILADQLTLTYADRPLRLVLRAR